MTKAEARLIKTIHAIWDMMVMKYPVERVIYTYGIDLADLEMAAMKIREKCNEYREKGT